jgi:Kdo2-lipid IVA lauroyltransferase/acyltransferase
MSVWKKIRHRIEAAALRFVTWLVPRLSRGTCVRLANALGELAARLDRRGRAVAIENLRCAFGNALAPEQRVEIMRASYRNFARTMLDLFWAPALVRPENRHWLRVEGWPDAKALNGRGVVFATFHFGNWEWASYGSAFSGLPCVTVAETLKNPALGGIFTSMRQLAGQTIIPQENSMLRMLKTVKRGRATALLADLTLRPGQASTVIRAFGLDMCVSVLHAVLAQRARALVVPALMWPDADGGATLRSLPAFDCPAGATLQQIAQACWDACEPHIRRDPGLWLWAYKHFRYRPRDAKCDYPAYANESGAFERLRARELAAPAAGDSVRGS